MRITGTRVLVIAGGLVFGTAALADGMTHAQYEAAENAIEADSKAAKKHCDALGGRAEDVCEAEAKGTENVAKADLEARYEPTAKNVQKARNARDRGEVLGCHGAVREQGRQRRGRLQEGSEGCEGPRAVERGSPGGDVQR